MPKLESESESESDVEPEIPELEFEESDVEPEIPELEFEESDAEPEIPELEFEESDAASEIPELEFEESDVEPELPELLSVQTSPSTFLGNLYNASAYAISEELHTQMSRTVYDLASDYLVQNNAVFSASEETKYSILEEQDSGAVGINMLNLTRTIGGYVANQASSHAAAKAVALAYQNVVGNVELQAEYELSCKLVETCMKTLPADFLLLQQSLMHIVGAIPVGFMNDVVSPMMAECVRNTPLGVLVDKLSADKSTTILKALFNVPAQSGQMLQCKTQGQYKGLIAKAIDTLKVPGLGSMQDANSVANLYQAYIKLSIVIPRLQAHYDFLNETYTKLNPALNKVRNAALSGPAAASFAIWWAQPSEPPQCIQDAMFLCQAMIGLCVQKSNEMIPYIQAGRQGMCEVIDPDSLAKQLVCATVNIGLHQAKQLPGQALECSTNQLIDSCLNSAVYNAMIGPVSGFAPVSFLNVGVSAGITSNNVVKAIAVFDAPIKQTVISDIQTILKDLDVKFGKSIPVGLSKDLSKTAKCFALYSVGVFDGVAVLGIAPVGGTVLAGVGIAALTLPELLKHVTSCASEMLLHHAFNKGGFKQRINDVQCALSNIIRLCITPQNQMLENIPQVNGEQMVPVNQFIALQQASDFGKKIGIQINQKLPQGLNALGKNMGIEGNIADAIIYPKGLSAYLEDAVSLAQSVWSAFTYKSSKVVI